VRAYLIAGLLTFVALAAGCGGTTATGSPDSSSRISVAGGVPAQAGLIDEIVGRLGAGSDIASVEIGSPPKDFESDLPNSWLTITINAVRDESNVKQYWEAMLLAGAFRDSSDARKLPAIIGKTVRVLYSDGTVEDGGSTRFIEGTTVAVNGGATEDTIKTAIDEGAAKANVHVRSVSFEHPLHLAPLIDVTADADYVRGARQELLTHLLEKVAPEANPPTDGTYVEVRDAAGHLLTASGYSTALSEGAGWTRPDLRTCESIC
jgi:hypothetical protein